MYVGVNPKLHTHSECGPRFHPLLHTSHIREYWLAPLSEDAFSGCYGPVSRPIKILDCVLPKDEIPAFAVGLGPKIDSRACLWVLDCVWNVMAHAQKPDLVFRRKGRFHLNRQGRQFSRLLAAEVCASAEVMLDTPCSVVVWRVLATHSIRQFPLYLPSRASPCAITFQLDSTKISTPCQMLVIHSASQ
jgi:hypothetical protein